MRISVSDSACTRTAPTMTSASGLRVPAAPVRAEASSATRGIIGPSSVTTSYGPSPSRHADWWAQATRAGTI